MSASNTTPAWLIIISSIVGGGVVGSIVSTYITSGREARVARAKVRERLFVAEHLRWADSDYQEFRQAISKLEATALIARTPRELVQRYIYIAEVAHYTEIWWRKDCEQRGFPQMSPRSLPLDLAELVDRTILILVTHLWHPWSWRFRRKRSVWFIDRMISRAEEIHPNWTWNPTILRPVWIEREPGLRGVIRGLRKRIASTGRKMRSGPSQPA